MPKFRMKWQGELLFEIRQHNPGIKLLMISSWVSRGAAVLPSRLFFIDELHPLTVLRR